MALGEEVPITGTTVSELEEFVLHTLGLSVSVSQLRKVSIGANNARHLAITTQQGHVIGLKAVTRGIVVGDEKEALISQLALTVNAPNACRVTLAEVPHSIELLRDRRIAVSTWLFPSKRLAELGEAEVGLFKQSETLLLQLGEWIAFGTLFGIRDRNSTNWVVDLQQEKLSMIDNEAAFEAPTPSEFQWFVALILDRNRFKSEKRDYVEARPLIRGIEEMLEKYLGAMTEIRGIISSKEFCREFGLRYADSTSSNAANEIIDQL